MRTPVLVAIFSAAWVSTALAQATSATPPPTAPAPSTAAAKAVSPPPAPKDPPVAASPATVPPPVDANTADEAFDTRVKTLEEQVVDLKEKIFRTKARLLLLQETVLGGDLTSGARAVLFHRNEMGGSYILESVAYALDGAPIFTKVDVDGDLARQQELEIFNGRIIPGQHQVAVRLVYRGHGFGVFSYLEGYKFRVQSSYTFDAEPAKVTSVKVVGYEKGGITTDLKDRPAIRYDVEVSKDQPQTKPAADTRPATP